MNDDRDEEYEHDEAEYADRICDDDCRGANGCGGHVECAHCGDVVCGCDVDPDTGLCDGCYSSRKTCANCTEGFWGEVFEASDGEVCCSQDCLDDYESGLESGRESHDRLETGGEGA